MLSDDQKFEVDVEVIQKAYDAFASGDWGLCFEMLSAFLRNKRRCGEDQWHEWASDYLQRGARWYRNRLRNEILGSWKAGEYKSRAHVDETLEQRAADMMVHVNVALAYIQASENRDACLDVLDGVPHGRNFVDWNTIAATALRQDVLEDLFDDHIMGDTEPLQVRNGWCETCESWKPEREEFPLGEYVCAECSVP